MPVRGLRARRIGIELQGDRIDAVSLPGRPWPIVEYMAQMPTTPPAGNLGSSHSVAVVFVQIDVGPVHGLYEAWPPGARVELGVGPKEFGAAAGAPVRAVLFAMDVLPGERALRPFAAQYGILFGRERFTPLPICLLCLRVHVSLYHAQVNAPDVSVAARAATETAEASRGNSLPGWYNQPQAPRPCPRTHGKASRLRATMRVTPYVI